MTKLVRLDADTTAALDAAAARVQTRMPAARISRDALARLLLRTALHDPRVLRSAGIPVQHGAADS